MASRQQTAGRSKPGNDADAQAYLHRLGERLRGLRAQRGMTRKILARDSKVSERYLAQLEGGRGNISILLLRQIAGAMNLPLGALVHEGPEPPLELTLLWQQLRDLTPAQANEAQSLLQARFAAPADKQRRIALVGLRGAGKSTLGQGLADRLEMPFVQLDRQVEAAAGMSLEEIFDLLGQSGFRRLERQCLDDVVAAYDGAVIEVGGGLVSEPATYQRLLSSCYTVWLRAQPDEHMQRVVGQGDQRPMAGNREAMTDLRRILAGREALYDKADAVLDTSRNSIQASLDALERLGAAALALPGAERPTCTAKPRRSRA